jgi:hypothetical protein
VVELAQYGLCPPHKLQELVRGSFFLVRSWMPSLHQSPPHFEMRSIGSVALNACACAMGLHLDWT